MCCSSPASGERSQYWQIQVYGVEGKGVKSPTPESQQASRANSTNSDGCTAFATCLTVRCEGTFTWHPTYRVHFHTECTPALHCSHNTSRAMPTNPPMHQHTIPKRIGNPSNQFQ